MTPVQEIKNGDRTAFELVYKQLHVKLYRFLLKRTRSAETAQEVVQLSFIRLWQFRHTLSEAHTIDTQLFTIARTTLFNYLRDRARERRHLVALHRFPGTGGEASFSPGETPDETVIPVSASGGLLEANDELRVAMQGLPTVRRKIFMLSRFDGLSNKEIAHCLSISVKTVEDHMSKALRYLRSMLTVLMIVSIFN